MSSLKIFYVSSEVSPFAKTGGLADIANSLPKAFKAKEHDIRVMMPKYRFIPDRRYTLRDVIRLRDIALEFPGAEVQESSAKSAFIDDAKVQIYFSEISQLFSQRTPYVDPKTGKDFKNNFERFAYFSLASLMTLKHLYWQPDVIHCNDWQTALIPVLLKTVLKDDPFFQQIKTVLTIHNMAFQGIFPMANAKTIGLDTFPELLETGGPLEFHGQINLLKGGIYFADKITTVSPGYLTQLMESDESAFGLMTALKDRKKDLVGILNGIDTKTWDPQSDSLIEQSYSFDSLDDKKENRKALLEQCKLEIDDSKPLLGFVARLTEQKGVGLILENMEKWLKKGIGVVVLGSGEKKFEDALTKLSKKYGKQLFVKIGYDETLSHQIQASADIFLMPSYFEPCGLTQLYSMRYGTLPIAFHTGGLIDTIVDLEKNAAKGTGFLFDKFDAKSFDKHLQTALKTYKQSDVWRKAQIRAMKKDFSWDKPVNQFIDLFHEITGK